MDVPATIEFLLQSQARTEALVQEIAEKHVRTEALVEKLGERVEEIGVKHSQNETLVKQLILLMSQLADRQAKQYRELTAVQKKTEVKVQELSDEVRSLVAAIRNMISRNGRKRG